MLLRQITIKEFITYARLSEKQRAKYKDIAKTILMNPTKVGTPNLKKINGQDIWRYGTAGRFDVTKIVEQMRDCIMENLWNVLPIQTIDFPIVVRGEYHHIPDQDKLRAVKGIISLSDNIKKSIERKTIDQRVAEARWDIENQGSIWMKVFNDCIKPFNLLEVTTSNMKQYEKYKDWKGIIPDDKIEFHRGDNGMTYYPVEKYEDRKIIFNIYKHNEIYKNK